MTSRLLQCAKDLGWIRNYNGRTPNCSLSFESLQADSWASFLSLAAHISHALLTT